jgi:hypothetical protein
MAGSGIYGKFAYANEGTWGTFNPTADDFTCVTMDKEDWEFKKGIIQSKSLHGGPYDLATRRAYVKAGATGTVDLQVYDSGLGGLFQNMLGFASAPNASGAGFFTVYTPGDTTGQQLSVQISRPMISNFAGGIQPFQYTGVKCVDWTISLKGADLAMLSLGFDGKKEDPVTITDAEAVAIMALPYPVNNQFVAANAQLLLGATPTTTTTTQAGDLPSFQLTTLEGGTAVTLGKEFSVKGGNVLDTEGRTFIGSLYKAEQLINGFRTVTGAATIQFQDLTTVYDAFASDISTSLWITLSCPNGLGAGDPSNFHIIVPTVFWDTDKLAIGGPELIDQSCTWSCYDNQVDNPIQFTSLSSDATVFPS